MQNKNSRYEFVALLVFLTTAVLLTTNGFVGRILAAPSSEDEVYESSAAIAWLVHWAVEAVTPCQPPSYRRGNT